MPTGRAQRSTHASLQTSGCATSHVPQPSKDAPLQISYSPDGWGDRERSVSPLIRARGREISYSPGQSSLNLFGLVTPRNWN